MPKTKTERIAGIDEQIAQLEAQKKQLMQKQKEDERKARTKRLCSRHGLLEKYMPALITITDEQFEQFVKRGIDTSYGQKILTEIIAKTGASTSTAYAETSHAGSTNSGANPPKAEPPGA